MAAAGAWCIAVPFDAPAVAAQKPGPKDHPAVIDLESIVSPCPVAEIPPLRVRITAIKDATILVVRLEASGALGLLAPASPKTSSRPTTMPAVARRFENIRRGAQRTLELPLVYLAGHETGALQVRVEARDADDRVIRFVVRELNAYAVDGKLYYGPQSLIVLMQTHVLDLERAGLITPQESLRRRQELATLRHKATPPTGPDSRAEQPTTTVPTERNDE